MLLIGAEALNELGYGDAGAFEALNAFWNRVGLNNLIASDLPDQRTFREQVYRERRVEQAFENHRWFDLLRTGQALDRLRNKNIQSRNLLLPIPQREQDINPNLTPNAGH